MNEGRYEEAIKPLKKAFQGKTKDRKAGLLLIESYYMLQNYQEALDVAELMDIEGALIGEEVILLTDVLIANNDFSRAYLNLLRLLSEGGEFSEEMKWLQKTQDLLAWDTLNTGTTVSDLEGVNTVYNEYSPYITEDGIIYVADHLTVQVLYPSAFTNQSLHLFYKNEEVSENKFGRPKMLVKSREYYYHDGTIEKVPNSELYATTLRDIDGLLYDLKMNIYFTNLSGSEEDLKPFKYNGTYNTGHPAFANGGQRMYFTSDRPGGYGQLDLWYSDKVNGEWTTPKNAGPSINSAANELYPKIKNERLFFSSDRRDIGYGGLDLYYVSLRFRGSEPYNLRAPINSAYDDFGVDFLDNKLGYFSSNRTNGYGGDDIYKMFFQPETTELDTVVLALEDMSGNELTMRIFDSEGNEMVGISRSGKKATLSNLLTRELYTISTDSVFDTSLKLIAYDKDGEKIQEFYSDSSEFKIEFLEQESYDMAVEENVDDSELFDLFGSVVSVTEEGEDFSEILVVLEESTGDDIKEAKTDSTGKFVIENVKWDQAYRISTKGNSGEIEIDILGETKAPLTSLQKISGKNSFAYTRARPEAAWMTSTHIEIPTVFGIIPTIETSGVSSPELRALGDSLIRECPVDEDGFVELGSLITGHAYELRFDQELFDLRDKLVILDGSGDTTQTVRPDGSSSFVFEFMPPPSLQLGDEEDLSLDKQVSETIVSLDKGNTSEQVLINLSGKSIGHETSDKIKLYSSSNELISETNSSDDGQFKFGQVPLDSLYFVRSKTKELRMTSAYHGFESEGVLIEDTLWRIDFRQRDLAEKTIPLPNIYYQFDSYTLSSDSKESLENLYGFLRQNPKAEIKILSHTDSRGPSSYNEQLSNLRAREVVRYLIRKGIDEDRLSYEGRGESQLVNECKDGTYCTNEKHAENRRTEFTLTTN